ncbi:hypothetical protein EBZ38_06760 [bacterium]|nr:hypothetical protein [bacterium]
MTDFVPGFSYPNELKYELPTQTPPGIRVVQLRQFNTSNLPNVITPGQEIQIDIPQIDFSFLDPSTTSLCVKGKYVFQVGQTLNTSAAAVSLTNSKNMVPLSVLSNGVRLIYPPIQALAARPHAFLGKGWGMFRRYCVYANTNILTDDIVNIGVLQNYMDLLTTGRNYLGSDISQCVNNPKLAGSNFLAVFPEAAGYPVDVPTATLNVLNCQLNVTKAWGDLTFNDDAGITGINNSFGDVTSGCFVPTAYDSQTGLLEMSFEISLPLMGVLGSGNDKMYPLFIGPTRISLYTEDLRNYIYLPQSPLVYNFGVTCGYIDTRFDLSRSSLSLTSVEFVGNYYRCDTTAFQYILGQLPVEGKMILRTLSYTYSNAPVNNGTSGNIDLQIASRRASQKALMILCTNDQIPEKSYGSACPYLGQNTCLLINGVQYPQLGVNFLSKPHDAFRQNLVTLNMSYSALVRPAISYGNWARLVSTGLSQYDPIGDDNNQAAAGYPATITSYNQINPPLLPNTPNAVDTLPIKIPANQTPALNSRIVTQVSIPPVSNDAENPPVPLFEAQPTGYFLLNALAETPFWTAQATPDYEVLSFTPHSQDSRSLSTSFTMSQNQWVSVIDTEQFGRRGYLNGISTLSGSNFFSMNIQTALPLSCTVNFFSMFDAILVFDYTTKQVSWKI